jgi:hypothetical protein
MRTSEIRKCLIEMKRECQKRVENDPFSACERPKDCRFLKICEEGNFNDPYEWFKEDTK